MHANNTIFLNQILLLSTAPRHVCTVRVSFAAVVPTSIFQHLFLRRSVGFAK